jgi:uncharacterized integral membrane protein
MSSQSGFTIKNKRTLLLWIILAVGVVLALFIWLFFAVQIEQVRLGK